VTLYIEVLNHYLLYYEQGVDAFSASAVQQVVETVQGELTQAQAASRLDEEALR
jgi:hypothetical protein